VIADPVVRNRGTIGGSLCQADAAEDLSAVCSAAKAQVVIRGAGGERVVSMEGFHVGPYMTAVGEGEILTRMRLAGPAGRGQAHEKVEAARRLGHRRRVGRRVDRRRADRRRRHRPQRGRAHDDHLTRAEELLRGKAPSEALFEQAGANARRTARPMADGAARSDYKRHLAGVLTTVRCAARRPARRIKEV
jgi:carbon-monoxide dehydrogenase medium subunit